MIVQKSDPISSSSALLSKNLGCDYHGDGVTFSLLWTPFVTTACDFEKVKALHWKPNLCALTKKSNKTYHTRKEVVNLYHNRLNSQFILAIFFFLSLKSWLQIRTQLAVWPISRLRQFHLSLERSKQLYSHCTRCIKWQLQNCRLLVLLLNKLWWYLVNECSVAGETSFSSCTLSLISWSLS